MSLIGAYQEELDLYTSDMRSCLSDLRGITDKGDWTSCHDHIEEMLSKSTDIMQALELEIRACAPTERRHYIDKLRSNKDTLGAFKTELTAISFENQKASLIGGKSGEDRRRLIDANEKYVVIMHIFAYIVVT
jgi:hypothetical protein